MTDAATPGRASATLHSREDSALGVICYQPQQDVARELIDEFLASGVVNGILLDGSFARGEARPDSDLDFYLVLNDDEQQLPYPHRFERRHVQVDLTQHDKPTIIRRISERPMRVYRHLFGHFLVDRTGELGEIETFARSFLASFRTSSEEAARLVSTLRGLQSKMLAVAGSGDQTHVGWSATWSSGIIAEGLFAANDRPLPPGSLMFRMLVDLPKPDDLRSSLVAWFGGDASGRHEAAMRLLDFALKTLS